MEFLYKMKDSVQAGDWRTIGWGCWAINYSTIINDDRGSTVAVDNVVVGVKPCELIGVK